MKLKQIIAILILLISNQIISQSKMPLGTYLSNNKLEYIVLLKNNTFGFISYQNNSPYLAKQKVKHKSTIDKCEIRGFLQNATGFGKYKIENDSIKLTFNESKSMIDSIKINYLQTEKFENPINITFAPHYNYKNMGTVEIEVTDLDNKIIAGVYENNLSPNIGVTRFPLNLLINNEKELELKTAQNQKIDIYVNCFKTYNINEMTTKKYLTKSLTFIVEE